MSDDRKQFQEVCKKKIELVKSGDNQEGEVESASAVINSAATATGSSSASPSLAALPLQTVANESNVATGSFMAGSLVLSNSILDEVLNEKKLLLMQSPDVLKFLREAYQGKP